MMIKKIKNEYEELSNIVISSLHVLFQIAIARDPCKKCIVKACCNEICIKRRSYIRLRLGSKNMIFAKSIAYFCIISWSIITVSTITTMFQ